MLIDANHLKLTLHGRTILRDVSLHLSPGEIYGLLGPNGAGKSTTIAVLLGLYALDEGELQLFDGNTTDTLSVRRRIGAMPENAGFYDWMSASEYLAWYAGLYGGLQQPVPELLDLVGLGNSGERPIGRFSQGMKQRLALARALAHTPELLILDEPTNGLDPRGRREIHDLLVRLARERQVGILLCTHLLDDVEALCDCIGIIDQGCMVAEGSLAQLLRRSPLAQSYWLRMTAVPDSQVLPRGVRLLRQEGEWWHLGVTVGVAPKVPALCEDLAEHGWGVAEIKAGGGLEALYLQLTTATGAESREEAA